MPSSGAGGGLISGGYPERGLTHIPDILGQMVEYNLSLQAGLTPKELPGGQ
jgi:hypothetical protein